MFNIRVMAKRIHTETELWDAASAVIERLGFFGERFEDRQKLGIPDAYVGAGPLGRAWIELKIALVYRPGQLAWALRAKARGERAMTLQATPMGAFRLHDTAMIAWADAMCAPRPAPLLETKSLADALGAAVTGHIDPRALPPPAKTTDGPLWPRSGALVGLSVRDARGDLAVLR